MHHSSGYILSTWTGEWTTEDNNEGICSILYEYLVDVSSFWLKWTRDELILKLKIYKSFIVVQKQQIIYELVHITTSVHLLEPIYDLKLMLISKNRLQQKRKMHCSHMPDGEGEALRRPASQLHSYCICATNLRQNVAE